MPIERAEPARALMLDLFPQGFEEIEHSDGLELVAYTDDAGEERLWAAFGEVRADEVPGDWDERWREFHRPVRVGRLWIGPPWETTPEGVEAIVVDPGRAFGTGGHATTRLCLELLDGVERGSLLDVGCGSGVLAIAAARLGFGPVLALDHDPAALEATERNAAANGVELDTRLVDALSEPLPAVEAAVANISAESVQLVMPRLDAGTVVASGYLERDEPAPAGFRRVRRVTEGGWAADLFRREE
ncbi:MAG TPA: 50S ribosomal protein L11 methyltransferase [Gaiellaceae bacterium]|nr:50S ribosomal protein L11 methyltransferase [Gaiellaceae bacterium]